ncbi:MAG: hypothetical protein ACRCYU_10470 [Nocardioides sp.]
MASAEIDLQVGKSDEMRIHVGASPLISVITSVYEMLGASSYRVPHEILTAAG